MCRAEAHQLYARKSIFDALGFQLITVLHEQIDSEVLQNSLLNFNLQKFIICNYMNLNLESMFSTLLGFK